MEGFNEGGIYPRENSKDLTDLFVLETINIMKEIISMILKVLQMMKMK